jgi:hypothetical protein
MDPPERTTARWSAALDKEQQAGKHHPARLPSYQVRNQQQRQGEQSEESRGVEKLHAPI